MLQINQPVIPKGSNVLITGINGFIASNIADQFLKLGYKVRGTTRDPQRTAWVADLFDRKYGHKSFEMVVVPNIEADGAFDHVMGGVSAVIHTASIVSLDLNPHNVIPGAIAGTINALSAAAKEPGIKRFVVTSSSTAAHLPRPSSMGPAHHVHRTVTINTWNDEMVASAYRDQACGPDQGAIVYAASKTLAEKAAWDFVCQKKPAFTMNTVLPDHNFGASLDPANQGYPSTLGFVADLFRGNQGMLSALPSHYFVDVEDTALLHVAAAIHPCIESERIFAYAEPYNGNDILAILRKMYPDRAFCPDFHAEKNMCDIVPRGRAKQILRDMGKDGWTSLEESIRKATKSLV